MAIHLGGACSSQINQAGTWPAVAFIKQILRAGGAIISFDERRLICRKTSGPQNLVSQVRTTTSFLLLIPGRLHVRYVIQCHWCIKLAAV